MARILLPEVPERFRKPLKWVGYPLFAVAVLNISFYLTLPRARIEERVENAVGEWLNADVSSGSFNLTILTGPGLQAEAVAIKPRPTVAGEKPATYKIDAVTVHAGIVDLMHGYTSLRFRGSLFGGSVSGGQFRSVPDEGILAFEARQVALGSIPNLGAQLGMPGVPLGGTLGLEMSVRAVKNLLADSYGSIALDLESGVLGDGKAKLTVAGNPVLASGLTVPRIKLGNVKGSASIDKGRATLSGVKAHSTDLDLEVQGYLELRDPAMFSQLHLYVLIKPSDALLKREANLEALVAMGGGIAKRTDGYFGISITGTFSSPLVMPSKETPPGLGRTATPPPRSSTPPAPSRPFATPQAQQSPTVMPASPPPFYRPPPPQDPSPSPGLAAPPPAPMNSPPPTLMEGVNVALPPPPRMGSGRFGSMPMRPTEEAMPDGRPEGRIEGRPELRPEGRIE